MEQHSPQIHLGCKCQGFFLGTTFIQALLKCSTALINCSAGTYAPSSSKSTCILPILAIVLLLQELKEISTPSPPSSNMEMQQQQRKGKEQRPPHQIRHPLPLPGSFCPFCHERSLRQQHLLQADMEVPFPSG